MKKKCDKIILGDFKLDTLVESCDRSKYKNLLNCFSLSGTNFLHSRVTSTSATWLDHVISSYPVNANTIKLTISEHYVNEMELGFRSAKNRTDDIIFKTRCLQNNKKAKSTKFSFFVGSKTCVRLSD